MKYDDVDTKIIQFIQGDIPIEANPFAGLALSLGISETELLNRIRNLKANGIIRRWGAVLSHQKAGYSNNAMVAWQIEPARADRAGEIMAGMKEISHCYLREVPADFNFQLFSMVHARDEQELENTIHRISELTDLHNYAVLRSVREFKKVSMRYI